MSATQDPNAGDEPGMRLTEASDPRWRAVFHTAGIGIALVDPQGRVLEANPALSALLGYSAGELIGRSFQEITWPDDVAIDAALFEELLDGRRDAYQLEKRYIRRDGTTIRARLSVSAVRAADGDAEHVVAIVEDAVVPGDPRHRDAREGRERTLRSVVEHGSDVVTLLTPEGEIRFIGPSIERLLGYTPRQLEGRSLLSLVHPSQRQLVKEGLGKSRSNPSGSPRAMTLDLRHRDGSWRTHEAVGTTIPDPIGGQPVVVVNSRDVTDRMDAQQALERAERRFRNVVEQNLTGIYVTEGGRFTYANPRFCEIFGYTLEELQALDSVDRLVAEESLAEVQLAREARVAGEPTAARQVFTGVHKSGRRVVLDLHATASEDEHGVVSLTGTVLDVTEQRLLEAQLRQRQKMEAIGQLAGGVAHDFNNLLTVIQMNLDFALAAIEPGSQVATDLGEVARAAERARALTAQLLAFGRQQALSAQALDINEVVRTAEPLLRRLVGEGIQLDMALGDRPAVVKADVSHLEQVLMNLVVNARDAILERDAAPDVARRITLATATRLLDSRDAAAWPALRAGEYVELRVQDTGTGMTPEVLARVFEPFYTTKPVGKGTGLGLSTVFGIVAQSGGVVRADSSPGNGSTFTILIPVFRPPARVPRGGRPATAPNARLILLADDERPVRRAFVRGLERLGYRVIEAEDGAAALRAWAAHRDQVTALVTDIRMPEVGGLELAARLREERPDLPIVFVSGYSDQGWSSSSPLDRFLAKPVTPATLGAALAELLADAGAAAGSSR